MTNTTTREQAVEVLKQLTAEHSFQSYFLKADVVYNDGFFGVDISVDGKKWRDRQHKEQIPPQINRVPICVMVHG